MTTLVAALRGSEMLLLFAMIGKTLVAQLIALM